MLSGLAPSEVIAAEAIDAEFSFFFQFSPTSSETQRPFPNVPQYTLFGLEGCSATTYGSVPFSFSSTCHLPAESLKMTSASPITTNNFETKSLPNSVISIASYGSIATKDLIVHFSL